MEQFISIGAISSTLPMAILEASKQRMSLPRWLPIGQNFPSRQVGSVEREIRAQLAKAEIASRIKPGMRVAVAVGSRGIGSLQEIVRVLIADLRERGTQPFIIPSMGSHGGATAEGQLEVLSSLGITEKTVNAPIRSSMETVALGRVLDDVEVVIDKVAFTEADAIIPVARVKPHTGFRGEVESGLHKMLGLGLGKHAGASYLHTFPLERFGELVAMVGQFILQKAKVPFGLAIVEDAHEKPGIIEAVPSEAFAARDRALLQTAKQWLPGLPFSSCDVLLVQQLGKNISGLGMDPNVTGRFSLPSMVSGLTVGRLIVLDLTPETHGNATGIGLADIIAARAAKKIDWHKTYTNHVAAGTLAGAKQPLVAESDREALMIGVATLARLVPEKARIAWIKNTLEPGALCVSEPLWADLATSPGLTQRGEPAPINFDGEGNLVLPVVAA